MSVNYREVPNQFPEDAVRYADGIGQMNKLAEGLFKDGKLPERFRSSANTGVEAVSPEDLLRQQMYELLGRAVNPTEEEKRELGEKMGLVFLPIVRKSYLELVTANPRHYLSDEGEYANARPELRDYRPPVAVEVGFKKAELVLPDSLLKSRYEALQMIRKYSQQLTGDFPAFQAIGLPVTGYAAADEEYARRNPGQALFKREFAWGLDNLPGGCAADAGRSAPGRRFRVDDWYPRYGRGGIGGAPAVVKIGTK